MRRFWFWPLALLALPNCSLYQGGLAPTENVKHGASPESDAIFCDIQLPGGLGRHCASPMEQKIGLRLIGGAIALVEGRSSNVALDYSLNALNNCNGDPEAVVYETDWPAGSPVCLNCGNVIPSQHASAQAVCEARCADLAQPGTVPPIPQTLTDCAKLARPSTNAAVAPPPFCFANACSPTGNFGPFMDPRRTSEPATWATLIGVSATGADNNTLARTTVPANNLDFHAGAASNQTIDRWDGYVEFVATETKGSARLGGLKEGAPSGTPDVPNIDFAISLFTDGCFYIFEKGTPLKPQFPEPTAQFCTVANAVGSYKTGDKFRISIQGYLDGTSTGTVFYDHISADTFCQDGSPCSSMSTQKSGKMATYPLRFESAFREQNASLANVRLVRIRQ